MMDRFITVVIKNPSNDEATDFCARMIDGNVTALGVGDSMTRCDVAESALRELEHDEVATEALEKIDAMDADIGLAFRQANS